MNASCHLRTVLSFLFVLGSTACFVGPREVHAQPPTPSRDPCANAGNPIPSTMYFMSKPQDAAQCSMAARDDGQITIPPPLSNPGMSCPDMFSWKLFASAVRQEFWKGWAADQQTWPGVSCPQGDATCTPIYPLPLCSAPGAVPGRCCDPKSLNNPGYDDGNNPAIHCPYFPGDHLQSQEMLPLRLAQPPSKAHLISFAASPQGKKAFQTELLLKDEKGRKIRQSMAEVVFRNKPMFDFVFQNDLYHQEGISAVFHANSVNIFKKESAGRSISGMPYRLQNQKGRLAEIDFPVESIMIKSNWVAEERASELGLKEDPANPYIKMTINSPVTDNNGTILLPGVHWLVAFHISSKDTPNWVWTTFEHVNNPGRCDYTGCNDSYGYASPDKVKPGQATNYTQPNVQCDNLLLPSYIFNTGGQYAGGNVSSGLDELLRKLRIGLPNHPTNCKVKGPNNQTRCMPSPEDTGWRSYRLKGAQVNFTDSMGRATRLGNSVTEGGFVNTSSCISCHARAGTTQHGTLPPALGIFVNELSEAGYGQSHFGVPMADWYHHSGQPPRLNVLQTDFVWGFLTANRFAPGSPSYELLESTPPEAPMTVPSSVRGRTELPAQ